MAFTSSDLTSVETAIINLAKGDQIVSVTVQGRTTQYNQASLPQLRELRAEIRSDIATTNSTARYSLASTSKGL